MLTWPPLLARRRLNGRVICLGFHLFTPTPKVYFYNHNYQSVNTLLKSVETQNLTSHNEIQVEGNNGKASGPSVSSAKSCLLPAGKYALMPCLTDNPEVHIMENVVSPVTSASLPNVSAKLEVSELLQG
ncbi:hypothetical protein CRM22_009795 [Opisthorchis felineus]|uniref:Uncharacterized protein n=1 Tax=Opisthorchis felineus TaxID=147828 RepID=A0A4S2LCE3_OPIFE|nr:hypothetical protein CRM22_009795 [Opisthorchis felineus]